MVIVSYMRLTVQYIFETVSSHPLFHVPPRKVLLNQTLRTRQVYARMTKPIPIIVTSEFLHTQQC